MIKPQRTCYVFLLLLMALTFIIRVPSQYGQVSVIDPPPLSKNASHDEILSWLNQYWFQKMGIGVDDRRDPVNGKTNRGFFKGFKLVSSDNCVLFFRNEGSFKDAEKTPYLAEATIPLNDLDWEAAKVNGRKPFSTSIDEGYGLWEAEFMSRKFDLNIILNLKLPDNKSYSGSIVEFTLPTKDNAIQFSNAFLRLIKTCKAQ